MAWVFQFGTASLGVIVDELMIGQSIVYPRSAIPGRDGQAPHRARRNERRVRIRGRAASSDTGSLRTVINSIQSLAYGSESQDQQLHLHDDRHLLCRVTAFDITYIPGVAAAAVALEAEFIASHPFFINDTSFTAVNCVNSGSSQLSFSIVNTGTARTPLRTRFVPRSGDSISFGRLLNHTTGEQLEVTKTVSFNDEITVNISSVTCVDTAGASLLDGFSGTFWSLDPGSNSIEYVGSHCNVHLEWNPRYDA